MLTARKVRNFSKANKENSNLTECRKTFGESFSGKETTQNSLQKTPRLRPKKLFVEEREAVLQVQKGLRQAFLQRDFSMFTLQLNKINLKTKSNLLRLTILTDLFRINQRRNNLKALLNVLLMIQTQALKANSYSHLKDIQELILQVSLSIENKQLQIQVSDRLGFTLSRTGDMERSRQFYQKYCKAEVQPQNSLLRKIAKHNIQMFREKGDPFDIQFGFSLGSPVFKPCELPSARELFQTLLRGTLFTQGQEQSALCSRRGARSVLGRIK